MYSIILAAALTTAPEPGFNGFFQRNNGCAGCMGCSGCMGCQGCQGCNGCQGGGFLGVRSWFRSAFNRDCHGCQGCSGCMGCQGCFGGCQGFSAGCMGCMGSMSMSCFGSPMSTSAFPMSSPMMMNGAPMMTGLNGAAGDMAIASVPHPATPPAPMPNALEPAETAAVPGSATVVVTMPADARLFIDGAASQLTGSVRVFRTPALASDKEYYYTLKMEVDRGGKTQTASETVILQPGKVSRVTFTDPTVGVPAKLHVRVPQGGTLFVEGQSWPMLPGQKTIRTPNLEQGREYFYSLKLEIDRDGQKESITREVSFRAGANVNVDFDTQVAAGK